ncbi:MAG: hypothetical protein AAF458_07955 [Pseudomonadota bacterium]
MPNDDDANTLARHLVRNLGLDARVANRAVAEMLAYLDETADAFVVRRHRELQQAGLSNEQTFDLLQRETAGWRFAIKPLTKRQIRRLIYG